MTVMEFPTASHTEPPQPSYISPQSSAPPRGWALLNPTPSPHQPHRNTTDVPVLCAHQSSVLFHCTQSHTHTFRQGRTRLLRGYTEKHRAQGQIQTTLHHTHTHFITQTHIKHTHSYTQYITHTHTQNTHTQNTHTHTLGNMQRRRSEIVARDRLPIKNTPAPALTEPASWSLPPGARPTEPAPRSLEGTCGESRVQRCQVPTVSEVSSFFFC